MGFDAVQPLLLLFAVAGGYTFLQVCHVTKHRFDALEWDRNLFEATLTGGIFFVFARLILSLPVVDQRLHVVRSLLHGVLPVPYVGSLLATLCCAVAVALVSNVFLRERRAVRWAVHKHGGELLRLLQDAAERAVPVSLTMANRKCYVGLVIAPPSIKYPQTRILPTISGHRASEDMTLIFDTVYWKAYEDIASRAARGEPIAVDVEDFGIVLPVEQIVSANIFDNESYERYFNAAG